MKLTAIILLSACLTATAKGDAQGITLSLKNAPLETVFKEVQKQAGYNFVYNNSLVQNTKLIDLEVKQATVEEVLKRCFKDQPFTYSIFDKTIVIKPKSQAVAINETPLHPLPIDIKGRVVNENGDPVAGATITVKGTNTRTASDANGYFELKNVDENATLIVSAVNIDAREIKVGGKNDLSTIAVRIKVTEGEAIVVEANTGFQTISRERSTGSYNVISGDQLEKPSTNIAQRLIGTTAGVQTRLDVNGNPTFQIRGLSTLNPNTSALANAQPLVVVDGFPIQGDFNSINPNDVESITILKDAAAASIWGAQSANGVIVITTKKAKKGQPLKVEFNAFTKMANKFDLDYVRPLAPSDQTVEYEKLAFNKWGGRQSVGSFLSDYNNTWSLASGALTEHKLGFITEAQRDAILNQLKTQDNRQQISDHLLANPVSNQYNLSLSSSSGRMSNYFSLMYQDNQSNFKESSDKKYMFNFRNNSQVFDWLDFRLNGMVSSNIAKNNGVTLADIQGMSPYEMLVNPDGSLTNIHQYYWPVMQRSLPMSNFPYADWTYNPIQEIQNRSQTSEQLNTRIQVGLTFKILKGLSFDTQGQFELFNTQTRNLFNENTFFVRNTINQAASWNQTTNAVTLNLPKGSIISEQNRTRTQSYNLRNQLNFNRVFSTDHEVSFLAGVEVRKIVTQIFRQPITYGYDDERLTVGTFPNGPTGTRNWLGANQTFVYINGFSHSTDGFFSAYGNAAYTFRKKYTVSGSVRTDASNLITDDPKYRYAPFWSVGLGWQLHKENFMAGINWLDMLNLRATYGYNGNVDRSTSFRPLLTMNSTPNVFTQDFTGRISSLGNPTLRWEKTGTWNVAADYSLFKGKLSGKVDVYHRYGRDLLAGISIPNVQGTTVQVLNIAEMTNKGIEVQIGSVLPISKTVKWTGHLNFSYNQNKITKMFRVSFPSSALIGPVIYVEGENANLMWRYKYAGLLNQYPQVAGADGATYNFSSATPGDGRTYMQKMGTSVAPYTLGFMSGLQVRDFNFSFIVTGKFGHVFQSTGFNYPASWTRRVLPNNKLSEVMNGDPSQIVTLPLNPIEPQYFRWEQFSQQLNYLIESASHLRIQEVNLSYNLPKSMLSRFNMSVLQFYAQGNDLFTLYWNDAKEDPEYPLGTMNPQPRITFGLRTQF